MERGIHIPTMCSSLNYPNQSPMGPGRQQTRLGFQQRSQDVDTDGDAGGKELSVVYLRHVTQLALWHIVPLYVVFDDFS